MDTPLSMKQNQSISSTIIVNDDFYKFISTHKNDSTNALRLKKFKDITFDPKFAILQIECRKKTASKIPELNSSGQFLFPSLLLAEQCTSEIVAKFHATLFENCNSVLDMTAGLCIDSYYISKKAKSVTALEIDKVSAEVNDYNMSILAKNIDVINCDSSVYIKNCTTSYDAIFIDPARRGANNSRVYAISDCNPNVTTLLHHLKNRCNYLIVKASPMIDISNTINEIDHISDIWIIGVKNECKELLFKVDFRNTTNIIKIHTINFDTNSSQHFGFELGSCANDQIPLSHPNINDYLYEPNSCVMKAGAFKELHSVFKMNKLHNNTHLFISHNYESQFPGRGFIVEDIIPFKDNLIKKFNSKYPKINVSVRNFKLTADQLKAKLKVNDGGEKYLFGVTLKDNTMSLIVCRKATS